MLLVHPGIYLFVPFIVLQTLGMAQLREGPFNTPMLLTPGSLAITLMNTLTTLIVLLLLFFAMDAMERERRTELAPIFHSTALSTAALFFGKIAAIALLGGGILLITLLACLIMLLVQGTVPIDLGPFVLVWGGLLFPTFIFWSALVGPRHRDPRNRYVVLRGRRRCADLHVLPAVLRQDELGRELEPVVHRPAGAILPRLELDAAAILANRVLYLSLVRAAGRTRVSVCSGVKHLTRPAWWVGSGRPRCSGPYCGPFRCWCVRCDGGVLWLMVWRGFEGEPAKEKQKDYWRQNVRTWTDAPVPALQHVVLDLDLQPPDRRFRAAGHYRLLNQHAKPLRQIALTGGLGWKTNNGRSTGRRFSPRIARGCWCSRCPNRSSRNRHSRSAFSTPANFRRGHEVGWWHVGVYSSVERRADQFFTFVCAGRRVYRRGGRRQGQPPGLQTVRRSFL